METHFNVAVFIAYTHNNLFYELHKLNCFVLKCKIYDKLENLTNIGTYISYLAVWSQCFLAPAAVYWMVFLYLHTSSQIHVRVPYIFTKVCQPTSIISSTPGTGWVLPSKQMAECGSYLYCTAADSLLWGWVAFIPLLEFSSLFFLFLLTSHNTTNQFFYFLFLETHSCDCLLRFFIKLGITLAFRCYNQWNILTTKKLDRNI